MLHIKKIKPLYTNVLTTADVYEEDVVTNGIIRFGEKKGDVKSHQVVLAVGPTVRDIQVGDKIVFDKTHYAMMKYDPNSIKNDMDMNKVVRWDLPYVTMDDDEGNPVECLLLQDRDIKYIYEGEEVTEPNNNNTIVIPDRKFYA